ncbi:helix-turn-helix domain-containing protein [Lactobacillus crispatus]|uniref:helix-turn-helix domain-containing protein n=1 Tax=Lactobacillus crispatus TaxID=47770 RepID=UPI000B5D987C|nr:helix-turn-helix transcriptional regulator [Lactobacillus crispatus]OXC25253.1 hypothetical protein AYP83_07390 [Lactobacillus crispatus]OXC26022.1 hypothetical protein AYP84_06075 [Lactobacillus crispatus]OXC34554.1 hypothetical protein AYP87_04585 [Lactobacillus crispatus]OXC39119.1 hypothetical protein AYP91_06405 [Lactobacillus crispatus]OXC39417.1 hypothetical protein AYP89_09945 [Lactobacillus crispatus]
MNRIKELREKRSLSQRQFVTDFNKFLSTNKEQYKNMRGVKEITFGTASRWENNLNKPTEYMWQALANFFNVSVDYLKGYGYSKEHIYKCLDDAYKQDYPVTFDVEPPSGNFFISSKDEIEDYCKTKKINIPEDVGLDFWQKYFSFIFKNKSVKRLLTTKDNYSDDDIKELIIEAISWYGTDSRTKSLVNQIKHQSK